MVLPSRPRPAPWQREPWPALWAGASSKLVRQLLMKLALAEDVPPPVLELALVPGRRFRADLAWPDARLYVEVDGGVWAGGRHGRGAGIESDCEKSSLAAAQGWRLVRVSDKAIGNGNAVQWIRDAIAWGRS